MKNGHQMLLVPLHRNLQVQYHSYFRRRLRIEINAAQEVLQAHIVELAGSYQSVAEDYAKIFEAMTEYPPQQFQGFLLCYDLQYQVVGQVSGKPWQPVSWPTTDTEARSVIICDDYDDGEYIITVCVDGGVIVSISVKAKVREMQASVYLDGSSGGGGHGNEDGGGTNLPPPVLDGSGGNVPPPVYFPNPGGIPIWNGQPTKPGTDEIFDVGDFLPPPDEPQEPPLSPADSAKLARLKRISVYSSGFDESNQERRLALARTLDEVVNSHPVYQKMYDRLVAQIDSTKDKIVLVIDPSISSNAISTGSKISFKSGNMIDQYHTVTEELIHIFQRKVIYRNRTLTDADDANLELEAKLIMNLVAQDNFNKEKPFFTAVGLFEHLDNPNLPSGFPRPDFDLNRKMADFYVNVLKQGLPTQFNDNSPFNKAKYEELLNDFINYSAYQAGLNSFSDLAPQALFFLFQNP